MSSEREQWFGRVAATLLGMGTFLAIASGIWHFVSHELNLDGALLFLNISYD